ncbi:MAG: hypothetical protein WBL23_05845 [Salinisphaera sp.]|uniref:hypothetical protein n=1 Tax=Salinisphaera sp. TaxID=1914330 RepID=UPI003C79F285
MPETVIGCPISTELAERARQTIEELRHAPEQVHREHVVELILELTEKSFDYHFQRPLRALGVGFGTRKSIDYGLKGAMRVIRSSMQRVIRGLEHDRYAKVADFLEDAYFPRAAGDRA